MLNAMTKKDGEKIVFTGHYMEAYIPSSYFEGRLGENYGSSIKVFGLFNVRCFDKNDKPLKLETLNIPTMITMYPSEIVEKDIQLLDDEVDASELDEEEDRYTIAKFYNGDVITNASIAQDASNVEMFLKILTSGKVPKTIPYSKVLQIWQENLLLNNVRLGVTSTVLEVIISEIYRNAKKPEETFAKAIGRNPNLSEYAYRTANIREVCARNSTFAAMTFEDMDQMITSSLNINAYGKTESASPIEKIIKM